MEITIEELNALTENTSAMRIQIAEYERRLGEKEKIIAEKDEEICQLKNDVKVMTEKQKNLNLENSFLRNFLLLSAERIKEFMKRVTGIDTWAFLRTFVEWSIPESARKEQMKLLDEVMALPTEQKPAMVMENPTFQGPMYDVHNNNEVRLEE